MRVHLHQTENRHAMSSRSLLTDGGEGLGEGPSLFSLASRPPPEHGNGDSRKIVKRRE